MKPYLSVHWPFHLGQVKIFSLASKFISHHKDFPTFSAWRTPRIINSRHFHLKSGRPSVNFHNNQKQVLFISYNVMQTLLTYLNLTRSYQASTVGILLYYFFTYKWTTPEVTDQPPKRRSWSTWPSVKWPPFSIAVVNTNLVAKP